MKEKRPMVYPKIEDLLKHTENKFSLVIEASKRARQITWGQRKLGDGVGGVAPLRLEDISNKPLSVALEEIAEGKIEKIWPGQDDGEGEEGQEKG